MAVSNRRYKQQYIANPKQNNLLDAIMRELDAAIAETNELEEKAQALETRMDEGLIRIANGRAEQAPNVAQWEDFFADKLSPSYCSKIDEFTAVAASISAQYDDNQDALDYFLSKLSQQAWTRYHSVAKKFQFGPYQIAANDGPDPNNLSHLQSLTSPAPGSAPTQQIPSRNGMQVSSNLPASNKSKSSQWEVA